MHRVVNENQTWFDPMTPARESVISITCPREALLVQDDGVLIFSSEACLCDVVGAVVSVDLSVFPINIGLWQGAQALQELRVKHQIIWLQHVLGQLQLCFCPYKAVSLRGESARGRCWIWVDFTDILNVCINPKSVQFWFVSFGFWEIRRRKESGEKKKQTISHPAGSTANLLNWLGVFGIIEVEAKFSYAWNAKANGNNGFGWSLLNGVVHVVRVWFKRLHGEIIGAFCL